MLSLVVHPSTMQDILNLDPLLPRTPTERFMGYPISVYSGVERWEVVRPYWKFPEDPFVTYEESDEAWCRPLRIGVQTQWSFTSGEVLVVGEVGCNESMDDMIRVRAAANYIASRMDNLYRFRVNNLSGGCRIKPTCVN